MRVSKLTSLVALLFLVTLALVACAKASPTPEAMPKATTAAADPFSAVPEILNSANRGWPREVEGLNGRVTIPVKPQRIINASVGHDEITYALVPASRVVGVGIATQDPTYSNVSQLSKGAATVTSDPEVSWPSAPTSSSPAPSSSPRR